MNRFLLLVFAWALLLFNIPLILSVYLFLLLITQYRRDGLVEVSSCGYWYIRRDGVVRHQERTSLVKQVDLSTASLKVSFRLGHGQRVTIWRDSCDDREYRRLCLVLKQWKKGARAPYTR